MRIDYQQRIVKLLTLVLCTGRHFYWDTVYMQLISSDYHSSCYISRTYYNLLRYNEHSLD